MGQQERGQVVDRQAQFVTVFAQGALVFLACDRQHPGVVDQDVQAVVAPADIRRHAAHLGQGGQIGRHVGHGRVAARPADFFRGCKHFFRLAAVHHNRGSHFRQA